MTFAQPIWLLAGLVACAALGALIRWAGNKRTEALRRFAAGHLLAKLTAGVSPARRRTKAALLVTATACLFTTLARPQWGTEWEEVSRRGIDILIAVDTSKSMLAPDLAPNRLSRAKLGIHDFVEKLEGDRVGLMPFAGQAFLLCPMTLDYTAFLESLAAVDARIIPEGGTDIAAAIRAAEKAFEQGSNHRILVLMTDGEDLEGEALEAAKAAAEKGITIHTVGVGTPNGELIPLGGSEFVKDENGEVVKSQLDEGALRQIAESTGGVYAPLGTRAEGLETIYREKLALVPKEEIAQRMKEVKIERFQWPLTLAILLLALEFCLGTARRSKGSGSWAPIGQRRSAATASAILVTISLLSGIGRAEAELETTEGEPRARYNRGTELYETGSWEEAEEAFRGALNSDDVALQTDAYYNLGNTLYRQGQSQRESSETEAVIERWEAAIETYENALALQPDDEDARFNKELVERKLEELKQEQESESESESEENSGEENEESSESESSEGENGEEESSESDPSSAGESGNQKEEAEPENEKDLEPSENGESEEEKEDEKSSTGDAEPSEDEASETGEEPGESNPEDAPEDSQESLATTSEDGTEAGRSSDQVATPTPASRLPGEMSEEEAQQLLDALSTEEAAFQAPSLSDGRSRSGGLQPKRDW